MNLWVHSHWQIEQLLNATLEKPLNVWLKIDTGMHRLGISPHQVESLYAKLQLSANVNKIILVTHFAHADAIAGAHTALAGSHTALAGSHTAIQINQFEHCVQSIAAIASQNASQKSGTKCS